jgi:hypothetical protein
MRRLHCRLIFAFIITVMVVFLAGCGVSVKPRSYKDVPPEEDAYYEESGYGSYYDSGPRVNTYHYYDPNYDPWTMGSYYQYYSGPPRTGGSSGGSGTGTLRSENNQVESKQPTEQSRTSVSPRESKAPSSEGSSSVRSRASRLNQQDKTRRSSRSAVSDQKVRSSARQQTDRSANRVQVKKREVKTRTTTRKTRQKSDNEEEEEEKKPQN